MNKFKVGDKVVVTHPSTGSERHRDMIGDIIETFVSTSGYVVHVVTSKSDTYRSFEEELDFDKNYIVKQILNDL